MLLNLLGLISLERNEILDELDRLSDEDAPFLAVEIEYIHSETELNAKSMSGVSLGALTVTAVADASSAAEW